MNRSSRRRDNQIESGRPEIASSVVDTSIRGPRFRVSQVACVLKQCALRNNGQSDGTWNSCLSKSARLRKRVFIRTHVRERVSDARECKHWKFEISKNICCSVMSHVRISKITGMPHTQRYLNGRVTKINEMSRTQRYCIWMT